MTYRNSTGGGGQVFVEKANRLEEMLEDESRHLNSRSTAGSSRRRVRKIVERRDIEEKEGINKIKARELLSASYIRTAQETQRNIERSVKRNKDKKSQKFIDLNEDIDRCLDFLDVVDKNISLHDEAELNKVKRQFGEWNLNVHGRIQDNISQKLNAKDYKKLLKEKNQDYQKFLDITNKKSAIFRDIIIESEYDPLEPNRRAIKASTGKLKDPTLHILQKTVDEMVMLDPEFGKSGENTGGKYTLPTEMWAAGKIEATPHGRFGKMMASANNEEKRKRAPRSKVVFDEYEFPTGKGITDTEMPRGKKAQVATGPTTFSRVMHNGGKS
jgi:hypothetical protein